MILIRRNRIGHTEWDNDDDTGHNYDKENNLTGYSKCTICNTKGSERKVRVYDDFSNDSHDSKRKHHYETRCICDRCYKLVKKKQSSSKRGRGKDRYVRGPDTLEWIEALKRSWRISGDSFRCELSALPLDTEDSHSPLSISCDHDPSGSMEFLVVAWVINDMKNDHDRDEFYKNIQNLAVITESGKPDPLLANGFICDFKELKHWKRK